MTERSDSSCSHEEVSQLTSTASATRRIAFVSSALAAFALFAGLATSTATATEQGATMAAKARDAKAVASIPAAKAPRAAVAASPTDFTSIFAGQLPAYTNSGWSSCATAITWSVDTVDLGEQMAARQLANLEYAFAQWSEASGLTFRFAGSVDLTANETSFAVTPADGSASPTRHINLAFLNDASSRLLGGSTVGMAGPSSVWADSKEIEGGAGIFLIEAVKRMTDAQARALFTHELGHVLGLGHAAESGNIMHPIVTENDHLGAGDVTGVRTLTKTCTA
jgi:hypothetical protein